MPVCKETPRLQTVHRLIINCHFLSQTSLRSSLLVEKKKPHIALVVSSFAQSCFYVFVSLSHLLTSSENSGPV